MKNHFIIINIIIILLSVNVLSAQTSKSIKLDEQQKKNVLSEISKTTSKFKTLECQFTQVKYVSVLSEPATSKGVMYYSAPDKLNWKYVTPKAFSLIANGSVLCIKSGSSIQKMDSKKNKAVQNMTKMIVESMNGKCFSDNSTFIFQVYKNVKNYSIVFIPIQKDMKSMMSEMTLTVDFSYNVNSIEVVDMNDDNTVITLTSRKVNEKLPDNIFDVN